MSKNSKRLLVTALIVAVSIVGLVIDSYTSREYDVDVNVPKVDTMSPDLKVLSFNVGLLDLRFLGRSILKPTDFLEERAARIPILLQELDADVIALQEIYEESHAESLIAAMRPYYPYFFRKSTTKVRIDNGLLVFSKLPITNKKIVTVGSGPWDEAFFSRKSIMAVELSLGEEANLTIVNIHPTSGGMLNTQDSKKVVQIRQEQIDLARRVGESFGNDYTIILGDFNAGPEIAASNYEYLPEYGYVDAYLEYCNGVNQMPEMTWDAANFLNVHGTHSDSISQRIDHIFLSPQLAKSVDIVESQIVFKDAAVEIDDETSVSLSDHYGVLAHLKFKQK